MVNASTADHCPCLCWQQEERLRMEQEHKALVTEELEKSKMEVDASKAEIQVSPVPAVEDILSESVNVLIRSLLHEDAWLLFWVIFGL